MALAAVGVFTAVAGAGSGPGDHVVVAARPIRVGEQIELRHLRVEQAELPDGLRDHTVDDPDVLVGRVAIAPIGEGELIQASAVTVSASASPTHEVALTLPRAQVAVGRLRQGERVDVYGTDEDRTWSVAAGAEVVQIDLGDDGSLTSGRELTVVVALPTADAVAAVVDALRRADVTVVRSTFAGQREAPAVEHRPEATE
jgi:hypothetical protein